MQQNPNISGKLNRHAAKAIQALTLFAAILVANAIDAAPKAAKAAAVANAGATGTIRGKVLDSANGEPMIGVTAVIKDLGIYGITDIDGNYTITNVPVGTQTVTYQITGYQSASTQVPVAQGKPARANVTMNYKVSGEVVVTAKRLDNTSAALLSKRKKAAASQDAIAAEQITRSPDQDAGDAARRVTGVTIVDGKYIYVRGLGERYSSVQFNGSLLPSPEPEKRVIPLDVFPVALLDNIVISKTYTANMSGDFSGGLVDINPVDFPDKMEAKVLLSTGYNTLTTFKPFNTYQGGKLDFLGVDDGTRALPSAIPSTNLNSASSANKIAAGQAFNRIYNAQSTTGAMPSYFNMSFGNTYKLNERGDSLGVIASAMFREQSQNLNETQALYDTSGNAVRDYKVERSQYQTSKAGLLSLTGVIDKNHKIRGTTMYTQASTDEVISTKGSNILTLGYIKDLRLQYIETSLLFNQASGEHRFSSLGDIAFNWKAAYSVAKRYEPDTRTWYQESATPDSFTINQFNAQNSLRFNSQNTDNVTDLRPELVIPFNQWSGLKSKMTVGGAFIFRDRNSKNRRFAYRGVTDNSGAGLSDIITQASIANGTYTLTEDTTATDTYAAAYDNYAGFGEIDMPIISSLRMVAGARYETFKQVVSTYDFFNPATKTIGIIQTSNLLPTGTLILKLTDDMNLRGAYSKTVSRPDFREMSEFYFERISGAGYEKGNKNLKQTEIENYDLRWEWFPSPMEVIAVSGFYKEMKLPIETILQPGTDYVRTFRNADKASNYGVELETRKNLGFISKWIDEFSINANFAYIKSNISISDPFYTNKDRALQGQSPYVINTGLNYDREKLGTQVSVLFYYFGDRITEVGISGLEDTKEKANGRLDTALKQKIGSYGNLKFTAGNILNPVIYARQGDKVVRSYQLGVNFMIAYSYTWN